MATPSTVTATVPARHGHYSYSNHPAYQANANQHVSHGSSISTSSRLPPIQRNDEYQNDYYQDISQPPSRNAIKAREAVGMATSESTPMTNQSKRERRPDWHEFYKNGPPKEIIVIDDDSPPPQSKPERELLQYSSHNAVSHGGSVEHTSKKRRTGYDAIPVRHQASYSNTNTPHFVGSASDTVSTDRTTSLQTTAPTSLGSHASGGSGGTYVESGSTGQKRKRVTRQTTAEEKKRKEIADIGDAYNSYIPPPKPPIKAKEVFVQPVKDVSYPINAL